MNSWSSFLLLTSDGGRTWKLAPNAPDLAQLEMLPLTPREGWLYGRDDGSNYRLYVTRDGASSWQEVAPKPANLRYSELLGVPTFEDSEHGFLQANYTIGEKLTKVLLATSDGGRIWKPDRMVANLDGLARIQYRSSAVAGSDWIFAASDDHPVLTKLGAGAHIDAGTEGVASRTHYRAIRHLSFATPSQGWVIVGNGNLLSTTDGGANWVDISPGPKPHVVQPLNRPTQ